MNKSTFSNYIKEFNFKTLFNELGWDNFNNKLPIAVTDDAYMLEGVVEKRGFVIFKCLPDKIGQIPASNIRKQIENRLAKYHFEHLVIYYDAHNNHQIWQLVVKEEGKPKRVREVSWYSHQDTEVLFQRLKGLLFSLDEEEKITLVDVKKRVSDNFAVNTEQVTKRFYTEFTKQHAAFLKFIEGIDDTIPDKENANKQWYASLMLNRLMFCYFIQKKGFLDQNPNYLHDKLRESAEKAGSNKFYSFYRSFLLELFHEGLGKPEQKRELQVELGRIPYLNGGLFDVHELEHQFDQIQVSDKAFEKIFNFFDQWNWHLDNRIEATGRDINPDVIGYIFEKYINDRASMGAYYTKEDITDYIGKNTIIPYLFDETKRNYPSAFKHDAELWQMLAQSGDEYIYNAVKEGIEEATKKGTKPVSVFDLDIPEHISKGLDTTRSDLLDRRADWNTRTPQEFALPTEIWRETIDRWKRYFEVKSKIENGEISDINDFITYNLNIRQFIQDYIESTEDPFFIRHFYRAIKSVTILDPTCGSGAFLFAALNILEPLYEACITRMEQFCEEQPGKYKFFEEVLHEVNTEEHPNLAYYIYKNIILNNLYGVDIMKEAVEIAKLRLFLKLVATVELSPRKENFGLEPLPDIDFNIRAGNTLVGFATEKELLQTIQKKEPLFADEKLDEFKEEFELTGKAFKHFQDAQLIENIGSNNYKKAKIDLQLRLKELNEKLNSYLATNYNINSKGNPHYYKKWLASYQPFHWFSEFYRIISSNGGFDVIIGNPPYVNTKKIEYEIPVHYKSISCGDLFGICIERSLQLVKENSGFGMIVPLSATSTKKMIEVTKIIFNRDSTWNSYYSASDQPASLFSGVRHRLMIFIKKINEKNISHGTNFLKWFSDERVNLFQSKIYYFPCDNNSTLPKNNKISRSLELSILNKVFTNSQLGNHFRTHGYKVYYHDAPVHWGKIFDFVPKYVEGGQSKRSTHLKELNFESSAKAKSVISYLNSSLFYWFNWQFTNCRDLTKNNIEIARFDLNKLDSSYLVRLVNLTGDLMNDLKRNSKNYSRVSNNILTEFDSFYPYVSKHIIDQIDSVLAKHYGFCDEELDFILNYDIKYRAGKAIFGVEENGEDDE